MSWTYPVRGLPRRASSDAWRPFASASSAVHARANDRGRSPLGAASNASRSRCARYRAATARSLRRGSTGSMSMPIVDLGRGRRDGHQATGMREAACDGPIVVAMRVRHPPITRIPDERARRRDRSRSIGAIANAWATRIAFRGIETVRQGASTSASARRPPAPHGPSRGRGRRRRTVDGVRPPRRAAYRSGAPRRSRHSSPLEDRLVRDRERSRTSRVGRLRPRRSRGTS